MPSPQPSNSQKPLEPTTPVVGPAPDKDKDKDKPPVVVQKPAEELSDLEREVRAAKLLKEHDDRLAKAVAEEKPEETDIAPKNFGAFSDHPGKFTVAHEMLGPHPRGTELSYRDLCIFDVTPTDSGGFLPDYQKPLVGKTKRRVDELVAQGALRPAGLLIATR